MALPIPNLDDRTFQDLVDEAKRHVQATFPDWTDHNVSDPGVTLIEAFAQMVDQLVYRLNRVPDRHYMTFLDLIGVRLLPPAPARGAVTFWLSAAQPAPVLVRAGVEVATDRTDVEDAVVFTTAEELVIPPVRLVRVGTLAAAGAATDRTDGYEALLDAAPGARTRGARGAAPEPIPVFSDVPAAGDALLLGLSAPAPGCAVRLEFDGPVGGIGIDPRTPPLRWEAWTASGWAPCDVDHDDTGGFNRAGDVLVHVPTGHDESLLAGGRAAWLRCLVTDALPAYTRTPRLSLARAETIGGTTAVAHARQVRDELLGTADGAPSARFRLAHAPVVGEDDAAVLEVVPRGEAPQAWLVVRDFGASGPTDRHVRLDRATGEVEFGPLVGAASGSPRGYGAAPPVGAAVVARSYVTGGGRAGNVGAGLVRVLKTSVPYVHAVENRAPTTGGSDGETPEQARLRGPLELRSAGRAVTADDFEELARAASPTLARVRCVPAADDHLGVRLLVLPFVPTDAAGRLPWDELRHPRPELLAAVTRHLDRHRLVGTRLLVSPPEFVGVTVVARLTAAAGEDPDDVRERAVRAVNDVLSPFDGGADARGRAFGRPVTDFEVSAALAAVAGVHLVEEVLLFAADPATGHRGEPVARVDVPADALAYSYLPQVRADPAP